MKNLCTVAILLGGLVAAPFHASTAQTTEVAFANEPRPGYVVFFAKGTAQLSSAADETIREAAVDAGRGAGMIRVVGRADHAQVVKNKLVRAGVPAGSVVVVPKIDNPLPPVGDGVSEPANRRVEIKY